MSYNTTHPITFGRLQKNSPYSLYKLLYTSFLKFSPKQIEEETKNVYGKSHALYANRLSKSGWSMRFERDGKFESDRELDQETRFALDEQFQSEGKRESSVMSSIELQRFMKEISLMLNYYKTEFTTNLLEYPPCNSNDEQKLLNDQIEIRGVKQTLGAQFKQFVNELAKKLNLSQVVCFHLVHSAQESYPNQFQSNPERCTISLYFEERQNILLSLIGLLQARRAVGLPKDLKALIHSYVCDIVKETSSQPGLVQTLVKKVEDLNQSLLKITDAEISMRQDIQAIHMRLLKDFYMAERQRIVECLFYTAYDYVVSGDGVLKILNLLSQSLNALKQMNPDDNFLQYNAWEKVIYTLVMTIVAAMDPFAVKIGDDGKQTYTNHNQSISKIDESIENLGKIPFILSQDIQGLLYLELSLCHEKYGNSQDQLASKRFDDALDLEVFKWISESLLQFSFIFEEDETLSSFSITLLSEMSSALIEHLSWKLEEIRRIQIDATRQRNQIQPRYHNATEQFMNFISSIYLVNSQQALQFLKTCYGFISKDMPAFFSDLSIPSEGIHALSFIAYTKLLSSLSKNNACAREIFSMLKDSLSTTFEWNSFFNVLKQFRYQTQAAQSKASHMIVEAILSLISSVAENFPISRPLFLQNTQWEILDSLFGFFDIPTISNELMGKVFTTISTLICDQNVALSIWNRIEYQQILITQNRSQVNGGIRQQLSKVESQEKNYSETIGFLRLLSVLFQYPVPLDLGLETRVDVPPGVGPYLDFVQKTVFNYFEAREYNSESQKWELVSLCLTIFHDILMKYRIHPSEFAYHPVNIRRSSGSGVQIRSIFRDPLPGFQILVSLLKLDDQLTTKGLLKIICKCGISKPHADSRYALQQSERLQSQGSVFLEKSILLSMKIFHLALDMQDEFRSLGIGKPLMEHIRLRPREDLLKGDDILHIAEYITYPHLADIRYYAIKLISIGSQLCTNVTDVFINAQQQNRFMGNLISRLRGDGFDSMYTVSNITDEDIRNAVLNLMLVNVDAPTPNLTHFLCGFETKWTPHDSRITIRLDDSHCLFTILQLLHDPSTVQESPLFVQKCYQLIYRLCLDKNTCIAVLHFLESTSFFSLHLLQQNNQMLQQMQLKDQVYLLHQRGFIFKIFALLIYVSTTLQSGTPSSSDNQLGTVQNLIRELFQDTRSNGNSFYRMEQSRVQILELLDAINLTLISKPAPISFQRFPGFSSEEFIMEIPVDFIDMPIPLIVSSSIESSRMTIKSYDIPALHSALLEAKYAHQREQGSVDTVSIDREIIQGLELAVKWNQYFQLFGAICNAFFGWKQIVEVAISKGYSMIAEEKRDGVVYGLINTLTFKLISEEPSPTISTGISTIILKLTAKLREKCVRSVSHLRIPMDQCLNILRSLIEAILRENLTPATRGNLYSALLYYLQYTKVSDYSLPFYHARSKSYLSRQFSELFHDFEKQQETYLKNQALLDEKFQPLIDRIGTDALSQRGAWKTTAFSTLDLIFSYDYNGRWIKFIEYNNVVSIGSILQQYVQLESQLISILQGQDTSLNPIYILESMISFLVRICQRSYLKDDTMYRVLFSICNHSKFLDWIPLKAFRPELDVMEDVNDESVSQNTVFHQILIPILQILASLLIQDQDNVRVAQQILRFISKYRMIFSNILKQSKNRLTKQALQEQQLVTSIFHLLFMKHHRLVWSELKDFYPKFENYMKNLLVELLTIYDQDFHIHSFRKSDQDAEEGILEICRNILGVIRVMSQSPDELNIYTPSQIMFTVDTRDRPNRAHSVNILVKAIAKFTTLLQRCDENIRDNEEQMARLEKLGMHDLKSIVETESNLQGLEIMTNFQQNKQYLQLIVQSIINQRLAMMTERVRKILFILENSLLILWLHMNYYLGHGLTLSKTHTDTSISHDLNQFSNIVFGQRDLVSAQPSKALSKEQRESFVRNLNSSLRQPLDALIEYKSGKKMHSLTQPSEFLSLMAYNISTKIYQGSE